MIRALIVDDEKHNRNLLANMLMQHFPNVEVIGQADSVSSSLRAIRKHHPDLVFLDIILQDGDAFILLEKVGNINFRIIFITAFEEYALKAIKFSALDYLLKPISLEELQLAIEKAEKQAVNELQLQIAELTNNLHPRLEKRIVLRTAEKLHLIPLTEIVRCQAERNYCMFYLENGKKIIVSRPIKDFEEILTDQGFFRLHKSHIVNLSYVNSYVKADGGFVLLKDGTQLPLSLRKKNQLIKLFETL
jgi:two-component system LytT family response regulator